MCVICKEYAEKKSTLPEAYANLLKAGPFMEPAHYKETLNRFLFEMLKDHYDRNYYELHGNGD